MDKLLLVKSKNNYNIRRKLKLPALVFSRFYPSLVRGYGHGKVDVAFQVPVVSVAVEQLGDEFRGEGN